MVNKKGLVRVVEATIAILIILGALLVFSSQREVKTSTDLSDMLPQLLDEVAKNLTLREDIVRNYNVGELHTEAGNSAVLTKIENFLKEKIANPTLDFAVRVCALDVRCSLSPYPDVEDVYVSERVISTLIGETNFEPKKIKIFLWRRP